MNELEWSWGAPHWIWPATIAGTLAALVLIWSYWRTTGQVWVRLVGGSLKGLAVAALAICLLDPLVHASRPRPGANVLLLLADNSQSLQIHDDRQSNSRAEQVREALAEQAAWQTRLSQDFDVRRYTFDRRLVAVRNFSSMQFEGDRSSLVQALQTVRDRFQHRPVAGILMFTDGNATDAAADLNLEAFPPVYPVVVGRNGPARDIRIEQFSTAETSFAAAPVTFRAQIAARGFEGQKLVAQLRDEQGKVVHREVLSVEGDGEPLRLRCLIDAPQSGLSFYELEVAPETELGALDSPQKSSEATFANNRRLVLVDRGSGPYRVLYVAGRPNWEFKYLRRAIEEDKEVELVGLVRIAKREPKFEFRGRVGESTNPLFRGFDIDDEEAEQYDRPVFVRLGTRDETELRSGFPVTADTLFAYHAVVLDDVEAEFFTREQQSLLERFVAQRGGGLLMLGGSESFAEGGYQRTPLADVLPVYLEQGSNDPSQYRLGLTREGWLQPWVRLRTTEDQEGKRLDEMPPFQVLNRLRGVKPGAIVLAQAADEANRKHPALVAQRYGTGRSAALLIGDLWRWQLRSEPETVKDLGQAWRQTIRWMVADVPKRVEAHAQRQLERPDQPIRIDVRVRDEMYEPAENATVQVTIAGPQGEPVQLTAEPGEEPGLYWTEYIPREAGAYRAKVSVSTDRGESLEDQKVGWTAEPAAEEFQVLQPNRELLERLAAQTGGEVLELDQLNEFVADLPNRRIPVTERWTYPLWHQSWFFALALLCLVAECGLRRWHGLP